MLAGLAGTAYTCLMVALYVHEPSQVELTVQDHVRVDRVVPSDTRGTSLERYGPLVPPGTVSLELAPGAYYLRTTRDAQVRLADPAAVQVVARPSDKDPWPPPPPLAPGLPVQDWAAHLPMLAVAGDGEPDHVPSLTVLAG
ncbi:MAG TPA: hypothetical protein VJT31_12100 [Rugosimonospora sp.]|nr:hypothetical protein [Rugosimonospora sp.]